MQTFFFSSFWKIRWTFFKVRSEIWRQEGISTTLPIFLSQPLQVAWSDFWKTGNSRVEGSHWFHWVSETVPLQKVQLSWGPFPFKLQVGTLHLLLVGRVEQDQRGDWGADLPNVDLGGGIWWYPWSFSWVFFYFVLGQLQRYQKNCYKPVVNNWCDIFLDFGPGHSIMKDDIVKELQTHIPKFINHLTINLYPHREWIWFGFCHVGPEKICGPFKAKIHIKYLAIF